jgi:hypothetical protein
VFEPGKSPVKVWPEILDIFFLGDLHVVYMDLGEGEARFSYGECDGDLLGSVSFHSPLFYTSFELQSCWFAVPVKQ